MKNILIQLTNNYNVEMNKEIFPDFDGRLIDVFVDGKKIENLEHFRIDVNPYEWDFNLEISQKYDLFDDVAKCIEKNL